MRLFFNLFVYMGRERGRGVDLVDLNCADHLIARLEVGPFSNREMRSGSHLFTCTRARLELRGWTVRM